MEMFSLCTWISYVDFSSTLYLVINCINKAKHQCNTLKLTQICENHRNKYHGDFYRLYTDGSKDKDKNSGIALFDPQTNGYVKLSIDQNVSIMFAELIAIAEAIAYIKSLRSGKYVIMTDSKSALYHLARCISTFPCSPVAYDLIKDLYKLSNSDKIIKIQWIPSHIGIFGNEESGLAKSAINDDLYPLYSDCLYIVKSKCSDMWNVYLDERSLTKSMWYKTIQPYIAKSPWFVESTLSRSDIVTALRLQSGHIPLNGFLYLIGKINSPNCTECNLKEYLYHVMVKCVRNAVERSVLQVDLYELGKSNCILAYPLSEEAKMLYNIVKVALRRR
ncbi:uncharacterized protein LOC123663940 [Melitaea cinxia]|uniref:uncharacterized protein LOC123663940 n=1 Tax=Melitaea cinxia TaxID=113334 RepID=UPI001E2739DB|nr:uncharacterized protein LOC123663940 [Melitaea cinxia]